MCILKLFFFHRSLTSTRTQHLWAPRWDYFILPCPAGKLNLKTINHHHNPYLLLYFTDCLLTHTGVGTRLFQGGWQPHGRDEFSPELAAAPWSWPGGQNCRETCSVFPWVERSVGWKYLWGYKAQWQLVCKQTRTCVREHSMDIKCTEKRLQPQQVERIGSFRRGSGFWVPAHAPHEGSSGTDGIQGQLRSLLAVPRLLDCLWPPWHWQWLNSTKGFKNSPWEVNQPGLVSVGTGAGAVLAPASWGDALTGQVTVRAAGVL